MRRLVHSIALIAGLVCPAAAGEPQTEEAAVEMLARVVILAQKCPRARMNYLTLGVVIQRHGVSEHTLVRGGRHHAAFLAVIGKLETAFNSASADEACAVLFDLYGAKGTELRGLVAEADPNDFFAFIDALGRGFGNLRTILDKPPKDAPK